MMMEKELMKLKLLHGIQAVNGVCRELSLTNEEIILLLSCASFMTDEFMKGAQKGSVKEGISRMLDEFYG